MDTASIVDKQSSDLIEKPGKQLAAYRTSKGLSLEYVASKLFLRTQLLESLEADNYTKLPQAVFIKGYIRSYANLLGMAPEPLISAFNQFCVEDRKTERTLWQSRRTPNTQERLVRWVTGLIVMSVLVGVTIWWEQSNHLAEQLTEKFKSSPQATNSSSPKLIEADLTQVSKLHSLFEPAPSETDQEQVEKAGG